MRVPPSPVLITGRPSYAENVILAPAKATEGINPNATANHNNRIPRFLSMMASPRQIERCFQGGNKPKCNSGRFECASVPIPSRRGEAEIQGARRLVRESDQVPLHGSKRQELCLPAIGHLQVVAHALGNFAIGLIEALSGLGLCSLGSATPLFCCNCQGRRIEVFQFWE